MSWREIGIGLLIFMLLTLAAFGLASSSWAQGETVSVNIPPQELSSALKMFAEQANLQILYASDLTRGLTTTGVVGTVTPQEAMRQLLDGTGLSSTFTDPKTVTLQTAAPLAAASQTEQTEPKAKPVKVPEVVVKEVRERGYTAADETTATRIPAPIQDVPRSVEVITRQVIDDQKSIRLQDTVRNVSGVFNQGGNGGRSESFTIRGFFSNLNTFKNGFRDDSEFGNRALRDTANLQRVEVVKGPPSYLFGRSDPGGVVNQITKDPLKTPYYSGEMIFGNYNLYRPTMDIGGPLNESKTLTYRFNGVYESAQSFREGVKTDRVFLAPTIGWELTARTTLRFEGEYLYSKTPIDRGITALGNGPAPIPISRFLGDPNRMDEINQGKATLILLHDFNDMWRWRSGFRAAVNSEKYDSLESWILDESTGNLTLARFHLPQQTQSYYWQNELHGKVSTGPVYHRLLMGVELGREVHSSDNQKSDFSSLGSFINIFNPSDRFFANQDMDDSFIFNDSTSTNNILGIYAGDQIDLLENLHMHAGGRFDIIEQKIVNRPTPANVYSEDSQTDTAFSPSIGITYQPVKPVALYVNYTHSFAPQSAGSRSAEGELFSPERGRQYEGGVKFQAFDGKLRSTFAYFDIKKKNVLTTGLDPGGAATGFSIATGVQRSKGFEFDVAGQLMPGWDIIANYAYIDARIEDDNTFVNGSRLANVPFNQGSLWTTYFIQAGVAKGLGAGIGLYAQSERNALLTPQVVTDPSTRPFDLPGFVRVDAALYYRKQEIWTRTNLLAAVNITNLLDQRYMQGASGFIEIVQPGAPVTVLASIKLEYN